MNHMQIENCKLEKMKMKRKMVQEVNYACVQVLLAHVKMKAKLMTTFKIIFNMFYIINFVIDPGESVIPM